MAGRTWHILALSAIALLFLCLAAQAQPSRMVDAGEILKKIELGQQVDYQKVMVIGDLNLNRMAAPSLPAQRTAQKSSAVRTVVTSPIRITDSVILNDVNFDNAILENVTDFQGTKFRSRVSMAAIWSVLRAASWPVVRARTCPVLSATTSLVVKAPT